MGRLLTRLQPEAFRGIFAILASTSWLVLAEACWAQQPLRGPQTVLDQANLPSDDPSILNGIGFDQKLDAQIPLDLTFRDEAGRSVDLGEFFQERPVVMAMMYYRCPMLCSQVLNGLVRSLRPLSIEVGRDLDVVVVSIDPEDTPRLATLKKANYLEEYGREDTAGGWHFLTGEEPQIRRLAESIGFRYTFNEATKLYAHAAGIVVATPQGRVSRYLFGIDYPPRDLQFAVIESSSGKIGAPIRRVLMFCYDYDAATGKYTLSIMRITQFFGVVTVLTLAGAVFLMLRWERRGRRRAATRDEFAGLPST